MKKTVFLHESFEVSIILKAIEAVTETLAGFALLFVTPAAINRIAIWLTQREISTDPQDFFANHLLRFAAQFSISSQFFLAFYLMSHGVVKIFIINYLWKGRLWAYPVAIGFFVIFILYQAYRYSFTHSFWLIILTIFDLIVIYLTWSEYQRIKTKA